MTRRPPLPSRLLLAALTLLPLLASGPAQAEEFGIAVEPAVGLADEDEVRVTLAGTPEGQGVYVRLCAQPPEGERPPSGTCDGSGYWAALPPGSPETPGQPMRASEGTFAFPVRVGFEGVDCTAVQCGIHTRRDHNGGDDTALDRFVPIFFASGVPGGDRAVARIEGTDRFGTAAALSRHGFPDGAAVVHVATAASFADALAAGPAAAVAGGPLLLVERERVPEATAGELDRLAPDRIVILGGTRAVSAEVEEALAERAAVTRLEGASRFGTAAAVVREWWPETSADVFVATGTDFPDALGGGAGAASLRAPILLVSRDAVPAETMAELRRLAPQRITIVGGPGAVSTAVEQELREVASTVRLAGASRFATAAAVAEALWPTGVRTALVATGSAFPDALAAAPSAGAGGLPVLLVARDEAPEAALAALERLGVTTVLVVGGPATISDPVLDRLRTA